jgi:hypothetical protein
MGIKKVILNRSRLKEIALSKNKVALENTLTEKSN